jgi:polyhydroxybutyrate depolymerase
MRRLSGGAVTGAILTVQILYSAGCDRPEMQPSSRDQNSPNLPAPDPYANTPNAQPPADQVELAMVPGATVSGCAVTTTQATNQEWFFPSGGLMRSAQIHLPPSYRPGKSLPVVLAYHALLTNNVLMRAITLLDVKADSAGFIAVYPQNDLGSWNAGTCCPPANQSGIDDVAYTRTLLDLLESNLCVDTKRIFATGYSNGGFMSHRLACELSDRIAAIAPVAGVIGVPTCTPLRPVPVFHIHGTGDMLEPFFGGLAAGIFPIGPFESALQTVADWARRDGCSKSATALPTQGQFDTSVVDFSRCAGGADVRLATIFGGGHNWPGGTLLFGYLSSWSANDHMWAFFQAHPMP